MYLQVIFWKQTMSIACYRTITKNSDIYNEQTAAAFPD